MIWKPFIGLARWLLHLVVPFAALFIYFSTAHRQKKATTSSSGRLEFTPNNSAFWAWLTLIGYLVYATTIRIKHTHFNLLDGPLDWVGTVGLLAVGAMILAGFPGTIAVTAEGLEQIHWLSRNKHIKWDDIDEINTGKKSEIVTITAKNGTQIVHSRQLPDRPRLLLELKKYCGENLPPDFPREPIADTDS